VAEIALTGVAPAIANAVYNATGNRVRHLPMTPDRLLNVL
jgi:xanthine dehydrogenase YagR molybdenum-binding subunit